jgi:PAS domain S-box-containing protein
MAVSPLVPAPWPRRCHTSRTKEQCFGQKALRRTTTSPEQGPRRTGIGGTRMYKSPLSVPKVAGAYATLHGLLFAAHQAKRIPLLAEVAPSADVIGLVNPLLFLAVATCFWAATRTSTGNGFPPYQRFAKGCAWLLVLLPGSYLLDEATGGAIGLEAALRSASVGTPQLNARLSPNSSLAFLLTGCAFLSLVRPLHGARKALFIAASVAVGLIGLAGIVGHLLGLQSLYKLPNFNRLLPPTAVAFAVVGAGLWALHEDIHNVPLKAIEGRIARRTLAVIGLVALGCGVSGFSVMRASFEEAVSKSLGLTANTSASSLAHTVRVALSFPQTVATRHGVAQALQELAAEPADHPARELLGRVARNILGANLTRAEFYNASGLLVAAAGAERTALQVSHPLKGAGTNTTLGWNQGYVLLAENDIYFQGVRVGRIVSEQRLPLFDELIATVRSANESSDAAICSVVAQNGAICAPTRFRREVFSIPLYDEVGKPAFPIVRALLGQAGVQVGKDPRNVDVISAHAPIGDLGLGLAVKTDVSTLYAPLRSRLALLVLSVTAIVGLAIYALRSQVRPVVKRLAESERNLTGILEEQTELVSLANPNGELTYVNPAYARHFGLRPPDMIGQNLFDHVEPADVEVVRTLVATVLETGQAMKGENRMVRLDGVPRWIAWTNSCQRGPKGRPMLHSVGRDITERKEAELALQESQSILARTGRVAGVGGWEIVIETGEVKWTDETRRIHEVEPTFRPTLQSALAFYDPESRSLVEEAIKNTIEQNHPFDLEARLRTAKGRILWVRAQGQAELEHGIATKLVGAVQDITDRRELELRLAANERFVRQVTDSLPVRIAYVDPDLRYLFVNNAHCKRFGLPREQILGRTRSELTGSPVAGAAADAVAGVLAGREQAFEFDELVEGRPVRIESHLIPDVADDGTVRGFYSTGVDITERSAAERALRDLTTIFDNTPDYVVQTDYEGTIIYVNPAAQRAFADDKGPSLVGRDFRDFLSPKTNELLSDVVIPIARATGVWIGETDVFLGSRHAVPVNHMVIAHRAEDGRVTRFSAIMRDISIEVAAKQREQRDAATLRSIAESMPAIVGVVGSDRRLSFRKHCL